MFQISPQWVSDVLTTLEAEREKDTVRLTFRPC